MNGKNDFNLRLQTLEEKFEYQDNTIETLNEVIIAQQKEIDELRQEIASVKELSAVSEQSKDQGQEPPPPHY